MKEPVDSRGREHIPRKPTENHVLQKCQTAGWEMLGIPGRRNLVSCSNPRGGGGYLLVPDYWFWVLLLVGI